LLYLMATGCTTASSSNAPRLNMTQYSLLTQLYGLVWVVGVWGVVVVGVGGWLYDKCWLGTL
jgi:hypothetical protein